MDRLTCLLLVAAIAAAILLGVYALELGELLAASDLSRFTIHDS